MQVKTTLVNAGAWVPTTPITHDDETRIQLRMLTERLYSLFEDAHLKGLGFLLPVAFRMFHEHKRNGTPPPNFKDLMSELDGQELMDFEHATKLFFGDEPEPDIDEPKAFEPFDTEDDDDDDIMPF